MATIYQSGPYLENHPTWHAEDSSWKAAQIIKAIGDSRARSIAEIGCGTGEILRQLAQRIPAEFHGFDISPQAIDLARSNPSVSLHVGNVEDMGLYDLVLAIDVIEHVEDVFGFLRALRKHGGQFIFHIPLDMTVYGVVRNVAMTNRKAFGHLHYFTRQTALAILEDCGYSVERWFYTPTVETWPKSPTNMARKCIFAVNQAFGAHFLGGYSVMAVCH